MVFYYTLLYLAPASICSALAVLATRRRAQWWVLDFLAIPLPGVLWMYLLNEGLRHKSFSNLAELLLLAGVMTGLVILRGQLGTRIPRAASSSLLVFVGLLAAVAIFFLVPTIRD
jgi:hypothetical protein